MDGFEDKCLELREENLALKRKKNEQEATIKRMYTKLAMIEETLKRKERETTPEADSPRKGTKRDIDTERFIDELRKENAALRRKAQLSTQTTKQLKGQLTLLKSKHPARPTSKGKREQTDLNNQDNVLESYSQLARDFHRESSSRDVNLEEALKARLVTAERRLIKLQQENEELRNQTKHDETTDNNKEHRDGSKFEIEQLQRELRDRQAQLVILNARYDNLESKSMAEREIQEKTLEQMESFNRVIHRLRAELQDAQMARDELEKKAAKAKDLKEEVNLLQEQNTKLEERMTSLCESPFINDAFQRKERIDKIVDLEKQNLSLQKKNELLQAENQKHVVVIQELQSNLRLSKQAKDAVDQEILRLKKELDEERNNRHQIQRQPTVIIEAPRQEQTKAPSPKAKAPSPVKVSVQTETFELPPPLTLPSAQEGLPRTARRLQDDTTDIFNPLLTDRENSVHLLKRKVHTLQIAHLTSTQELERCEKMLQAQTSINRELTIEIEELVSRKDVEHVNLEKKIESLELLAEQRLKKIATLEAQIRQLKYMAVHSNKRQASDSHLLPNADEQDQDDDDNMALLAGALELEPGENLLEIWIVEAQFDQKYVHGTSCTFILCDFYDYESQSTALITGSNPCYNFATSYKITADAFLLRYLASEHLALEVHQAVKGDFELVGKTALRLNALLQSKGSFRDTSVPIRHVATNAIMGCMSIVIRMAIPISETWRLHLQAHPEDNAFLAKSEDELKLEAYQSNVLQDTVSNLGPMNDLQIVIVSCRKLYTATGIPPSAYVHYQLLGFPDVFTDIVNQSSSPSFEFGTHQFSLCIDQCLKQFFRKTKLCLTVFDDNGPSKDDTEALGVIGTCDVSLKPLVDGDSISGWFEVYDSRRNPVGEILLTIQWKHPFAVLTEFGEAKGNALTLSEVHDIMALFSFLQDGRVNYRSFLVYAHASHFVSPAFLEIVQWFQSTIRHLMHAAHAHDVPVSIFLGLNQKSYTRENFLTKCKAKNIVVTPEQVQVLIDVLGDVNGWLQTSEIVLFIEPSPKCQTRFVATKIRDTIRHFEHSEKKGALLKPFERYDPNHCFYVSRAEFKRGLRAIGFHIYDPQEEEAKSAREAQPTERSSKLQKQHKVLDNVDEEIIEPKQTLTKKTSVVATTEFEQRKAAFEQRMKKAVKASHHSYVLDAPTLSLSTDLAARHIQRRFRHFNQTRQSTERVEQQVDLSYQEATQAVPCTIVDVEVFLSSTVEVTDSTKAQWMNACLKLDDKQTGGLFSKQMLHILNQPPCALALKPHQVQILLSYFTIPTSRRVAYAPLVLFVLTSPATIKQIPPLVKLLQTILVEESDFNQFCDVDEQNKGYLPYAAFGKCLSETCCHLSSAQVRLVMQLFDISGFGVDYRAFFQYMLSLPHNIQLQKIKAKLRRLSSPTLHTIQLTLAQAKQGEGFTKLQVSTLWKQANVTDLSWADQALLWQYLDKTQTGSVTAQSIWALFTSSASSHRTFAFEAQDLASLQHLAWNSRRLIAKDAAYLHKMFARYDWRKLGCVGFAEFKAVVQRAGFILSDAALTQVIAPEFSTQGKLKYGKFIEWTHAPNVSYADVEKRLQQFAQDCARQRNAPLSDVLNQWYAAFKPPVSRASFAATIRNTLQLPLQTEEIRVALEALDPELNDIVDYTRFVKMDSRVQSEDTGVDLPMVLSILKSVVHKQRPKVMATFEAYDGKDVGKVEEEIFALCWRKLGVELTSDEVHALFCEHAKNKLLNYRKFFKNILDCPENDREAPAEDMKEKHHKLLLSNLQNVANSCDPQEWRQWIDNLKEYTEQKGKSDVNTTKFLSILRKTMPRVDFIDTKQIKSYLHVLVHEKSGHVSLPSFIELLRNVAKPLPPPATAETKPTNSTEQLERDNSLHTLKLLLRNSIDKGIDYRSAFERYDSNWTGFVLPVDFKAALIELGLHMIENGPACIGHLIQHFRDSNAPDKVNYIRLLHEGLQRVDPTWQLEESLRIRIRLKAGITLNDMQTPAVYSTLDAAFKHFDQNEDNFLSREALEQGLTALKYSLSSADVQGLFDSMSIFKTSAISRVEFDAFVLDPNRVELLERLAKLLWKSTEIFASVSQGLTSNDNANGTLSISVFCRVLAQYNVDLTAGDIIRLRHIFDVNRQESISYKLFLRTMVRLRSQVQSKPESTESKASPLFKVLHQLRTKSKEALTQVFTYLDQDNRGTLAVADIFIAFKHVGIVLTPQEGRELVLAFPGGDHSIQYTDLLEAAFTQPAPEESHPIVSKLRAFLEEATANGLSVVECFSHFDTNNSGDIDAKEFRQGLQRLEFPVNDDIVDWVMTTFGVDGILDYRHFVEHLVPSALPRIPTQIASFLKDPKNTALFTPLDPMDTGTIGAKAFQRLLESHGVAISSDDIKVLLDEYGDRNTNMIQYSALLPSSSKRPIESILKELKQALDEAGIHPKELNRHFLHLDTKYTGHLSKDLFHQAFDQLNIHIPSTDMAILDQAFSSDNAHVNYREFITKVLSKK